MRAVDALYRLMTPPSDSVRLRKARVEAFTSSYVTLTIAGSTVNQVPYLSTYVPAVGHNVFVIQTLAGLLVVLGRTSP